MSLEQILILILAIFILICLFAYILAGEVCYKICLKRRAMAEKIINYEMDALADKLYKIDYNWWKKYDFKKICVKGHKGENLYPMFLKYHESKKVAIIIHGYFARFEEMNKYAEMFLSFGYNLVATQNRGHGESEGAYVGMGWLDRLDILEIIKKTIEEFGSDCEIVLFGLSMGGATVCMLSGEELPKNVTHLISDCGYTSVYEEFKIFVKRAVPIPLWLTLIIFNDYTKLKCGYTLKEADSTKMLPKCKIPILFIHGKSDVVVPYYMLDKLYSCTPKHLRYKKSFSNTGHAECLPYNEKEYKEVVLKFLKNTKK
ncbi:MAG: alpha/beta hydrolase [Clostridia bacterium]|nr:alpha/beta hydrolase [Clostridia bacterium]